MISSHGNPVFFTLICSILMIPLSNGLALTTAGQIKPILSTTPKPANSTTNLPPPFQNTTGSTIAIGITTPDEDNSNDTLSYDSFLYNESDSNNNTSGEEFDLYYNRSDAMDKETYYKYNSTEEEHEECEECFGNKLMHYAGRSTIVVTIIFIVSSLALISCVTYRNILRLVP